MENRTPDYRIITISKEMLSYVYMTAEKLGRENPRQIVEEALAFHMEHYLKIMGEQNER